MPRIDVHAHFVPAEYRAALVSVNPALGNLPDCSTDALLTMMKRFNIDAAVLSLSPPGVFQGDRGHARELARVVNQYAQTSVELTRIAWPPLACCRSRTWSRA